MRVLAGAKILPPFQWSQFTITVGDLDRLPQSGTIGTAADIQAANARVNTGITPNRSPVTIMDGWKLWPEIGFCGDFAVTKRHVLLDRGWPSAALLLAEVMTASGEEHCVLVVRTSGGDVVLDNLTAALRSPDRTGFKWVRIQSEQEPRFWHAPCLGP